MATFEAFSVVVVPFPFTDRRASKRRPALVLSRRSSFNLSVGHSLLAMITSRKNNPWPLDVVIGGQHEAGLGAPSVVRMKMFTLDNRLILRKLGNLNGTDRGGVQSALRVLIELNGAA